MTNSRETLRPYVADMAALEKHILEAVERQLGADDLKKTPAAQELIRRIQSTLGRHVDTLESHLQSFEGGGIAGTVKETVTGLLGAVAGLYDKVRSETVSRMLRDDYTSLSLAAVSSTMLYTSALAVQEQATAKLALSNLREFAAFLMEISEVVPQVVVRELTEEGKSYDSSLAQRAVRDTQTAWSNAAAVQVG